MYHGLLRLRYVCIDIYICIYICKHLLTPYFFLHTQHRPMYCSNADGDDCTKINSKTRLAVEELFHLQGVDLDFSAHEHSYERLYPVNNYTISKINNKNTTKQNCINDIGCQGITYYKNMESMVHIVSGVSIFL